MEPRSASARIARQRHVIAQMMTALGMEPTNIGKLSGVGGSTISRALKPDSTNLWRAGTIERLRDFAAERGYALDVAELTLRDAQGNEVPVGDEPIGRPRRSGADIIAAASDVAGADGGRDGGAGRHAVPVRAAMPPSDATNARRLSVRGRIVDGFNSEEDHERRAPAVMYQSFLYDDEPDTIGCPPWLLSDETAYALKVDGYGLDPVLRDGDYVFVTARVDKVKAGDVVLVGEKAGDGSPWCGLFVDRSGHGVRLRLMNGAEESIEPFAFLHRVAGIRRV